MGHQSPLGFVCVQGQNQVFLACSFQECCGQVMPRRSLSRGYLLVVFFSRGI